MRPRRSSSRHWSKTLGFDADGEPVASAESSNRHASGLYIGAPLERASIIFLKRFLENTLRAVQPGKDKVDLPALSGDENDLVLIICAKGELPFAGDRKSTRLNSSHGYISYA